MFFHSFFPQKFLAFTQSICRFQLASRVVFFGLFISQLSIFAIFVYKEIQKNRPIELHYPNSIKITDLKPIKATQAWSDLHFNTNISNGELKINNHNCLFGLGTHAQSEITYAIPPEAKRLVGFAGLDIVGGASGEVNFIIQLDGQEKWSSGLAHAKDPLISYDLETQGAKELKLIVDALGNNAYDHSNWCETQFVKE